DGRGPAINVPRSRRRALLVPEGEPQALHVGADKAGRAAHHLERVEQAAVRDRRLVVAAAHDGLARSPRVPDVVPHRVAGVGLVALWTAVTGALAAGILGVVLYQEITTDLPPVDQILHYKPPVTTRIYSDDGTLIGEFYVERRYLVPLERIPQHVRLAFLAAEDADFYRHRGVDPEGMARALLANLFHGHVVQGGSTITQQVVKALLLSPERSYERKLKELVLALRLEAKLSKDDILYLYLSQIYFGAGA